MRRKIIDFLKNPPAWFLAIVYAVTIAAAAGSVLCFTVAHPAYPAVIGVYFLYAFAAVTLVYSVYTVVKNVKSAVLTAIKKYPFFNRIAVRYGYRTVVFAAFSFAVSLANAALNEYAAIASRSVWYGALAAYYLLLVLMRGSVLLFHRNKKKRPFRDETNRKTTEAKVYLGCGILLVIMPSTLAVAVTYIVRGTDSFSHPGIMIYVSAFYTFYKIITAIVHIFKARKTDDMTVRALRSVNLADALVSILALQTAMFKEFGGDLNQGAMNAVTGAVVCALTAAMGIYMIVNGAKQIKKSNTETTK